MQVFVFRIFQGGRSTLIKRMQNKACISGMSDVHLMAHILYLFSVRGTYNRRIRLPRVNPPCHAIQIMR